jgi:hypothetical protein
VAAAEAVPARAHLQRLYVYTLGEVCILYVFFTTPVKGSLLPNFIGSNTLVTDSIFFLLFSLTFIAATLYLPHHMSFLIGRAWYYINGEHIDVAVAAKEAVKEISANVLQETATGDVLAQTVEAVVREL